MAHRGYDWTLLASGRVVGGCMESVYIVQLLILVPTAGTSRLPYQLNGLAVFHTRKILCFLTDLKNILIAHEAIVHATLPTTGCVGVDTESVIIDK